MALFGGTLTKLLATVAALMTVTAGVPRLECVCPDGLVKAFCSGRADNGCCSVPSGNCSIEIKQSCCRTAGESFTCCSQSDTASSTPKSGDNRQVIKACGCQRAIVADSLAYIVKDVGDRTDVEAVGVTAGELIPINTKQPAGYYPIGRHLHLPAPDLVVVHCHFTC